MFQFKKLSVKSMWGHRAEEVGVSVCVAKLFSESSIEEERMDLLKNLVIKSITDPVVQCKPIINPPYTKLDPKKLFK